MRKINKLDCIWEIGDLVALPVTGWLCDPRHSAITNFCFPIRKKAEGGYKACWDLQMKNSSRSELDLVSLIIHQQ